jgi:hypothetical protein
MNMEKILNTTEQAIHAVEAVLEKNIGVGTRIEGVGTAICTKAISGEISLDEIKEIKDTISKVQMEAGEIIPSLNEEFIVICAFIDGVEFGIKSSVKKLEEK